MSYDQAQRDTLMKLAREAIAYGLKHRHAPMIDAMAYPEPLREKRATFVTLRLRHELRGCMGTLEATKPLVQDIADHAYAAAFNDPRFHPLTVPELPELTISISVLSAKEAIVFESEDDLLNQMRPGIDGLILEDEARHARGTFLPSVWEMLPNRVDFWRQLKKKAGLPPDYWSGTLRVWRYTAEKIGAD